VIQGNVTKINKCVDKVPGMTILFFNYEHYDMRAKNKVEWDLWNKMEVISHKKIQITETVSSFFL
jgi:aspartate aminotransferase-like enzyme